MAVNDILFEMMFKVCDAYEILSKHLKEVGYEGNDMLWELLDDVSECCDSIFAAIDNIEYMDNTVTRESKNYVELDLLVLIHKYLECIKREYSDLYSSTGETKYYHKMMSIIHLMPIFKFRSRIEKELSDYEKYYDV